MKLQNFSLLLLGMLAHYSSSQGNAAYNNLFSQLIERPDPADPLKAPVGRKVEMTVSIGGQVLKNKLEIGLFDSVTPITSDNFYQLCVNGFYNNSPFHRIIPEFMIQGGDFTLRNGRGGHKFKYSPNDSDKFDDENFIIRHAPFVLSMANAGRNTNGSQFFITLVKTKWLDGKHTVFGRLLDGQKIAKEMETFGSRSGKTREQVMLVDCREVAAPVPVQLDNVPKKEVKVEPVVEVKPVVKAKPVVKVEPVKTQVKEVKKEEKKEKAKKKSRTGISEEILRRWFPHRFEDFKKHLVDSN